MAHPYPALRFFVISMGLVLVGGFVFVIAVVTSKLKSSTPCPPKELVELTEPGRLEHAQYSDKNLIVTQRDGETLIISRLDNCTGEQKDIQRIRAK